MKKLSVNKIDFVYCANSDELMECIAWNQFDLLILSEQKMLLGDIELCMLRSKNQIIFDWNLFALPACEQYLVLENGMTLHLCWTSFKGKPEKIKLNWETIMDMLFIKYTKKDMKILCVGSASYCALAAWKNDRSATLIEMYEGKFHAATEDFKQNSVQNKLIF